jgi:hypothetical protein
MAKRKKQEQDPPEIGKLIRQSIYRRFGLRGLVALALVGFALAAWTKWDDIRTLPGPATLLAYLSEDPVPKADPNRFAVLVARLENDGNDELQQLILQLMQPFGGVQVLRLDRTIAVDADRRAPAHGPRARPLRAPGRLRSSANATATRHDSSRRWRPARRPCRNARGSARRSTGP